MLTFPAGKGLSLDTAGLAPSGSYSVVMLFRLEAVADARRKLLDFAGGTSDAGLYLCDGVLMLETMTGTPCPMGPGPPANPYVQVVLTRVDQNDVVRAYLEGVEQVAEAPTSGAAALRPEGLRFFADDGAESVDEHAAGAVARIRFYDGVLTAEEVGALDRVDAVPPETAIDAAPPSLTNSRTPTFAFSSPEPGASFECLGPLEDGSYVFEVAAVDPAGNRDGSPAGRSFRIDTTPPRTGITGGPGDTTAATAAFFFSAAGAASFSCRLDGAGWRPCDSPHSYSGLSLGSHRFEVRAVDEAGNVEPSPAAHAWQVLRPGLVVPATLRQATALAAELVQMRRALSRIRLRSLRRRRAITLRRFDAWTAGTVKVRARARIRRRGGRRWVTVLVGKRKVPAAGRHRVRVKVTRKGRRLARRRRRLAVELRLSFTDIAGRSLWATTKLTLRR